MDTPTPMWLALRQGWAHRFASVPALVVVPLSLVLGQTVAYALGATVWGWRLDGLDLDLEASWFGKASALVTLAAGGLVLAGALASALGTRARLALGAALVFLGIDDLLAIHERVGWRLAHALGGGDDVLRLAWPVAYLPFLGIAALLLLRARAGLPRTQARGILVALALLALALVAELVGYGVKELGYRNRTLPDAIEVALEEGAEIAGWSLLLVILWLAAVRDGALAGRAARLRGGSRPASRPASRHRAS
ncbi:MAG: hypothetical protein R3C15_05730 [Thermoleophilia bacterium]